MQGTRTARRSGCGRWGAPREQGAQAGLSPSGCRLRPVRPGGGPGTQWGLCLSEDPSRGHGSACFSLCWTIRRPEKPSLPLDQTPRLLPSPAPRNCRPLLDPAPSQGRPSSRAMQAPPRPRPPSPHPRPGLGLRPWSRLHGP